MPSEVFLRPFSQERSSEQAVNDDCCKCQREVFLKGFKGRGLTLCARSRSTKAKARLPLARCRYRSGLAVMMLVRWRSGTMMRGAVRRLGAQREVTSELPYNPNEQKHSRTFGVIATSPCHTQHTQRDRRPRKRFRTPTATVTPKGINE